MSDAQPHSAAEPGRFEVWHRSGDEFTPVAAVRIGNLLGALVLTLSRKDEHWENGEHVVALQSDARSTDIGDVIVSPEGVAYEIRATTHGLVFEPIDFPPYREQMALFSEWRADYVAAAERDLPERFRELLGVPRPQPEPPRSANDNHQDRDSGIER
jgi:hypothetical protein